jgi:hypoxanthine phosphoribosyltransferase
VTQTKCRTAVGRVIYTPSEIAEAIERLATTIAADYRRKPLLLLGVLKGSLCFTVDLARAIARKADGPSEMIVDYMVVERYGSRGSSGGDPRVTLDCKHAVASANVLIADDIVDNGRTLRFLQALLGQRAPASLRSCALFDKPARREGTVPVDYRGMEVPDVFVIGYGLDYKEEYRNLPYLAELREEKAV